MRKETANRKLAWLPEPPFEFPKHYSLGNYGVDRVDGAISPKYLNRAKNLKQSWVRLCTHFPEATTGAAKYDVLEFSTAHGAIPELLNALGHRSEGTDYAPTEGGKPYTGMKPWQRACFESKHENPIADPVTGWVYQPIIESLGLKVHLFDAGHTPYPFEDKSYDAVLCYQAIEAYAVPEDWPRIVAEFCRIARKTVIIGFNPPLRGSETDAEWSRSKKAWDGLRRYNDNGFQCVSFEMEQTGRAFHPTACRLVAK